MATTAPGRPDLIQLDDAARERVLELVAAKGGSCAACGGTEFTVGAAMRLGFLFLDEDDDAELVALTCSNPDCSHPRTAIRLPDPDLSPDPDPR